MSEAKALKAPKSALKMPSPKGIFNKFRGWCFDKRWYFLAFFLPVVVMYIAYSVFGVHPFGDESVLVLDLNGQYVYYYELMHDWFWGDRSIIYSWSRNLSGELFGVFAYYLASPFMLIVCLLPRAWMCYSVMIMQLAKIGAASVTFMFFLKKMGTKKNSTLITFSLLYSLMSYMTVQLMDPMWLDGLVYLPLIMWGVHRLVDEGKMLPYIIPLALMFVAHFYIGYMIGFFTLIYYFYVCFTKEGRIFPKSFIVVCLKFFVGTVIAIMCACIVIIPVYNSLKLGKLEFTDPDFTLRTQFTFIQFFAKLFPLSYDTVYPTGLPMIYCGTLTLLLIPSYFLNTKINTKEKIGGGVVALVLIMCMWITPIDMAWHGFQVPNWLPYRYSFVFSAMLIYMAARAFENLDGVTGKALGASLFGIVAMVFYYESQGLEYFKAFRTVMQEEKEVVIPQGIIVTILAVLLCYIAVHVIQKKNSKIACVVLVGIVSLELFANTLDTLVKNDIGINAEIEGYSGLVYSDYDGYTDYMKELISVVDKVHETDDGFYRMESTSHRTVNDPIGADYAGISHSSSTMNAPALKLLDNLGYAYGGHYTKYDGATPLTDAVFGIKYILDRNDDHYRSQYFLPQPYTLKIPAAETDTPTNVYENPYALSVGMASDTRIKYLTMDPYNPFENQNNLLNYILSNDSDVEFFERVYYEKTDTENLQKQSVSNDHKKYAYIKQELGECHIDYLFNCYFEGPLYMFLPTMYERKVNIWVASSSLGEVPEDTDTFKYVGSFFGGDDYSITELGTFKEGDHVRVRVTITPEEKEAYWMDELFYVFNYDAFEEAINTLKDRQWNITKHSDTYLEGTVTAEKGQLLFTTIPYENGWSIEVDGRKVNPIKCLDDSMIAIPLPEGKHTVTMKFWPDYLTQAIIITICGILALAMVFVFEYKDGKIIKKIISTNNKQNGKSNKVSVKKRQKNS